MMKIKEISIEAREGSSFNFNDFFNMKHEVNVKIIQFGVNSNKATTGHELQGVS